MNGLLDRWDGALKTAVAVAAVAMAAYHLAYVYYSLVGSIENMMVHLSLGLLLVALATARETKGWRGFVGLAGAAAGVAAILYLWANLEVIQSNPGFARPADLFWGAVIVAAALTGCYLSFGAVLPLVAMGLLLYAYVERHFGGPILDVKEIISTVCLTFGGYDMWGGILNVSANVIFLFVLYGGLCFGLGATNSFEQIGNYFGRYTRAGPALSAVVSSCLMGTTTGQVSPNVAIVGTFTIPLMKRVGYKAHVAAAIEAAASAGGQIMPPIMGAGAFVMAELLGVSYLRVCRMAILPAMLYFGCVGIFVYLQANRSRVDFMEGAVDWRKVRDYAPLFVAPLAVILAVMAAGYPPMMAAFWGIGLLFGLSMVSGRTRPTAKMVLEGCVMGATIGAKIALACATLGPIVALVTKTGLGLEIGASVERWSGGNLFLGLVMLMAAVIVLGMEVPTVAAYLMAAVFAIPVLVRLGLDPMQAHMFAFYFGGFSALTPPVGMAAVVASKMAGASYLRTAGASVVAAMGAFIVPYVFVYDGSLLLLPGTTAGAVLKAFAATLAGIGFLQCALVGYLLDDSPAAERIACAVCGGILLLSIASHRGEGLLLGAVLGGGIVAQSARRRSHRRRANPGLVKEHSLAE